MDFIGLVGPIRPMKKMGPETSGPIFFEKSLV
jgi:hypothetical protein